MPSIYQLKPSFQNLLRPLTRRLAAFGVTANQVTLAALALSILVGGLVRAKPGVPWVLLLVPGVLFLRMALNAIDGMLAREHGMKSALGAVLNELGDVLSDAALYLPFAGVPGLPGTLIAALVFLGVIGEMAGVVAVQIGASRRYDGPFGKSDRAFVFGAVALALGLGARPGVWAGILFWFLIPLSILTILNRVRGALKEVRQ